LNSEYYYLSYIFTNGYTFGTGPECSSLGQSVQLNEEPDETEAEIERGEMISPPGNESPVKEMAACQKEIYSELHIPNHRLYLFIQLLIHFFKLRRTVQFRIHAEIKFNLRLRAAGSC
jgi:hypothetical protein